MSRIIKSSIPQEIIETKILLIRGKKVMLDKELANLYGVDIKQLKRQVRRNIDRFTDDFMFVLSREEHNSLRSQFVTLKRGTTGIHAWSFSSENMVGKVGKRGKVILFESDN